MSQKHIWRGSLIVVLTLALAAPARADKLQTIGRNIEIGIVAVTAALAVVVTVVIIHYSKKRTITGCVNSAGNGMTITDEKDRQTYALSGNTVGVTTGNRMKLKGKKVKPKSPDKTLIWEAKEVSKDLGVCQP
jgi:hypothetical protein